MKNSTLTYHRSKIRKLFRLSTKLTACGQTVLPDRSILIRQKLKENAKIERFKCDILDDFQTMCALQFTLQDSVKKSLSKTRDM